MPYTPYHFGPSGYLALLLRRWIDVPVFLLANVVIDMEVFFAGKWPQHRYWHFHTLLGGAIVGAVLGLIVYGAKPIRRFLEWGMRLVRIRYKANRWKMMVSGILGIWLHVLLDSIYHYDVQLFWPSKVKELQRPLWRLISAEELKFLCVIAFAGAVILYLFEIRAFNREKGRGC